MESSHFWKLERKLRGRRHLVTMFRAMVVPRRLCALRLPVTMADVVVPCHRHLCTAPSSSSDAPPASPKVAELVDSIASLTLLEAAELTEQLKVSRVRNLKVSCGTGLTVLCGPCRRG